MKISYPNLDLLEYKAKELLLQDEEIKEKLKVIEDKCGIDSIDFDFENKNVTQSAKSLA